MFYKQEKMEEKVDLMLEAFVEMGERLIAIENKLAKEDAHTN